jgi:hypothetical protein
VVRGSNGGPAPAGPPPSGTWWPPGFTIARGAQGERALDALRAVASAKGAPRPERTDLGMLMLALPDRDHAGEAESFRLHWLEGTAAELPMADVMRAYRGWLERA